MENMERVYGFNEKREEDPQKAEEMAIAGNYAESRAAKIRSEGGDVREAIDFEDKAAMNEAQAAKDYEAKKLVKSLSDKEIMAYYKDKDNAYGVHQSYIEKEAKSRGLVKED